jgi:hypothetical protein
MQATDRESPLLRSLETAAAWRGSNWFALIASIEPDPGSVFEIAVKLLLTAPVPGA